MGTSRRQYSELNIDKDFLVEKVVTLLLKMTVARYENNTKKKEGKKFL